MPSDNLPTSSVPPPPLPAARKPRRESRASTTNDVASPLVLNSRSRSQSQVLKDGHHTASVFSDLTSFSELTEPPAGTLDEEPKGLTSDIQGGLSGLYHKFRASMGGPKDFESLSKIVDQEPAVSETSTSQAPSAKASRMHSPRVSAYDGTTKMEVPMPKTSLKNAKLSLPSPGLRSPNANGPLPANLADPALTEVTIHATATTKNHSRTGSAQAPDDVTLTDRSIMSANDEQNLRRVLSRVDDARSARQERQALITQTPLLPKIDTKSAAISHSRGVSDSTNLDQKQKPLPRSHQSPASASQDHPLTRTLSNIADPSLSHRTPINPLELLAGHDTTFTHAEGVPSDSRTAQKPIPSSAQTRTTTASKSASKLNKSKMPGFEASRASSTDSGRTSGTHVTAQISRASEFDGHREELHHPQHHRHSNRPKSSILSKEFWMKDENARDCFRCGEPFTTFRRKHHCRSCGQIFDNKCTTLVSGAYFDMPGPIRVCKQCETPIISHDDDSSDYSDDNTTADLAARPRTPDFRAARYDDDNISMVSQSLEHIARTPVMSLPVRRAFDQSNRSSAVLEFDAPSHILHRPSSSRSLRTAHSMGHKRHASKHSHIRSVKSYHEEKVPFQRRVLDDPGDSRTSAFHRDSVIDPELRQYLSDDASDDDDDEPVLQPSHSSDKLSRSNPDSDRTTIGGLLAAMRKGRSRIGDRSIAGFLNFNRDADDAASIVSARAIEGPRGSRKRNLSVASSVHQKLTPRGTKERIHVVLPSDPDEVPPSPAMRGSRMIRSASMHGLGAPSLELNRASIQHVHKMLRQLLKDANVPKVSSWEDALIPILLRATDDVDPDVQGGDDIDIRSYVKMKKIPGGRPADTSYTSGVIFTKNLALKSMPRTIARPRIAIITFPLEYARSESHFMSLDPVIRQEREYLENLVSRVAALKPDVLLSQRNIAGVALELLDKAKIAVVFNVKPAVLEAVSRCTHTPIHNSLDKLTLPARELGTCELFEVKTFLAEGRRKTYVYISGCPPELGCTIALRGTNREALGKIKRITDFMIYVVYNLKLETCLMRDEWALIPTNDELARTSAVPSGQSSKPSAQSDPAIDQSKKVGTATNEAKSTPTNTSTAVEEASKLEGHNEVERFDTNESSDIPEDVPVPTFYQDLADKHQTRILSASPFVKFAQPYLLMRARELERRVAYLKRLRDQDLSDSTSIDEKAKVQKFTLITPEMVHSSLEGASRKVREIVHAVHDTEYDKAVYHYETQKKLWETHLSNNRNLFDPYAHQNIVVLFSIVSTDTNVPCSGPDIIAFNFYNEHEHEQDFEADCTLGQYVEDLCYRAEDLCPAETCGKKMHEHHRHYVHGEGQITVFVEPHPPKMRGLQDVILMWSTCKICGMETTVTPMSPSTWKYSFGKYLELSFWSADLHARAGGCPHDLHRDHLRYFGWKGYALRVHYDAIALLEVIVPRLRITWKVDNDLRFRNGVFTRVESRITKFMSSVKLRLKSINIDALLPESAEACRNEVERLTKQANDDHDMLIKHLRERYSNSMHWEIIPLNRALRALQEKVIDWEDAFADFEKNFFPSEKDIRRLATLQLKKIFLDRDVSVTSLTSGEDDVASPMQENLDEKEAAQEESPGSQRKLSPEKTQNVLQSVMEEHIGGAPHIETPKPTTPLERTPTLPARLDEEARRTSPDLDHLDLAVPGSTPKTSVTIPVPQAEISPKPASPEVVLHQTPRDSHEATEPTLSPTDTSLEVPSAIEINRAATTSVKSQLPTPAHPSSRRATISRPSSPLLVRAQSQPSGSLPVRKDYAPPVKQSTISAINATHGFGSERKSFDLQQDSSDKKLSERFGIGSLKNHKLGGKSHSLIPRAISTKSQNRVSNLAKHFEQLSREFEQARLKERRQRAARNRRSQVYPLAAPKAVVEVYSSVNEAVDEANDSEEALEFPDNHTEEAKEPTSEAMAEPPDPDIPRQESQPESTVDIVESNENDTETRPSSHAPSLMEDKTDVEDEEVENIHLPDSPEDLLRLSQDDVEFKELPKHERTSLMKMLTNFWAERSSSGWKTLEYPLHPSDHLFADCDIIVREDELSSIIAFALDSADYKEMLHQVQGQSTAAKSARSSQMAGNTSEDEDLISRSLLKTTSSHLKYGFSDGSAKMLCKVFFAEQFDAMRRKCGVAERFIESMSRCAKYDSRGGKSKSLFLKTLDDRFVLKTLSRIETQSFLKFAPNYFELMSEAFYRSLPSQIAKMLGFYQIILTNPVTGVEHNWFLLVMENLFYDRAPTRIFDLKGSMRNRKIEATGERNEVLLDENMVDYIYESPLFVREHSKKLLRTSVYNDTLFLFQQYVMDYSLMVAIDEPRKELVVGIIDCIRTYTWDKKLESWIKDRGFVSTLMSAGGVMGGGGAVAGKNNRPTVTSPTQYKKRFREAMNRYVLEAPSCWQRYRPGHSEKSETRREERIEAVDEGWNIS